MSLQSLVMPRLPRRPYCTDDFARGVRIRGAEAASECLYLQLNPPVLRHWLVFDIDRAGGAFAWDDLNVAPPNWIAVNPVNGHAHLGYLLEVPVVTAVYGRDTVLRYAAAIEAAFRLALRADPGYSGLLCKNPLRNDCWKVVHLHSNPCDLDYLAEWVTLRPRRHSVEAHPIGLGRNVTLFDTLRTWSYQWALAYKKSGASTELWQRAVLSQAEALNARFASPLGINEIRATSKSVAKWTWRTFTEARFSAIQSARGRRSGEVRREGSLTERAPWTAEGIGRSAWYARRKREREANVDANHIR